MGGGDDDESADEDDSYDETMEAAKAEGHDEL